MDQVSKKTTLKHHIFRTLNSFIVLTWLLAACRSTPTPFMPPDGTDLAPNGETAVAPENTLAPTLSPTPTNTPFPLALSVNGESISLAEYDAALTRLLAAQPDLLPEEARTRILEEYTDQILLSQAAAQSGFSVDKTLLEERIDGLVEQIGSLDTLNTWLAANGYTDEIFQLELRRSIAAAWMRDQIIANVPKTAEQVRARQILLFSAAEAADVYNQLQSGVTFEVMLAYYDPIGLGDLGWFPRGYLTESAIEETVFSLELEKYSPVIETPIGFHIIQLMDRQPDRPLDPDAYLVLQEKTLADWLAQQRAQSNVTVLIP